MALAFVNPLLYDEAQHAFLAAYDIDHEYSLKHNRLGLSAVLYGLPGSPRVATGLVESLPYHRGQLYQQRLVPMSSIIHLITFKTT